MSGGFLSPLVAEFLEDGVNIRLTCPLQYQDSVGRTWTVPIGFVTDGASIPRELWSTVGSPFTGKYRRAAVVHDYLYKLQPLPRAKCDLVLLEAMMKDGTEKILAKTIYDGVRLGGWKAWKDDATPNV